jgi:hypothetical protein
MHPGPRRWKGCLWVPLYHLPGQMNSATVSFGQLSKSVTLYDSASYNLSATWLFVIMFPRLVYLASIRTQAHLLNICLVIVIAFPQLVYLATRRSEWHLLPGRKSFVWLPRINERRKRTMPISVATLSKAWVEIGHTEKERNAKLNLNSLSVQTLVIPFTCITFTDSWRGTDNSPMFVQVHCSIDVANMHKWQIVIKYTRLYSDMTSLHNN